MLSLLCLVSVHGPTNVMHCTPPPLPSCSVFQRVLPLPSEAWGELSGSCFCHPPSPTEEGHTDPAAVKPRVGDCLLNDSVLLLQSCALNLDAIQLKKVCNPCVGDYKLSIGMIISLLPQDSSDSVQRLHCARCLLCLGSAMETQPGSTVLLT